MAYNYNKTPLEYARSQSGVPGLEEIIYGYNRQERISDDPWTVPAFYNAVYDFANAIARTDIHVKKVLANGGKEDDKNHPAYWLLTWKANANTTYFNFIQTLCVNCKVTGDGYAAIEREPDYTPIAIYNLNSRDVYPIEEYERGNLTALYYGVNTDKGQIIVDSEDMLHIKNLALNTGETVSCLDMMSKTIKKANAIQSFQVSYFKNGSHVSKVLKIPGWLNPEQKAELRQELQFLNDGIANAHRLAILQGGTELSALPLNAQDMELAASSEMTLTDIANIVGIPGTRIGARGAISYGSLEQDNLLFIQLLDNFYTNLEAELTVKLLRPRQQGNSHVIEFNRDSLLASDPGWRQFQVTLFERKVISLDEVRAKLGYPPPPPELTKPEPAPVVEIPAEEPPEAEETTQARSVELAEQAEEQRAKSVALTANVLQRIKTRLVKSVESGKSNLETHYPVIEDELRGLDASLVFQELDTLQEKLDGANPETRLGILKQWNTQQTALKIWS